MSEEDELLEELKKLSEASASSVNVDSRVDYKVNIERRRRILENLNQIDNKLKRGLALGAQYSLEKPLVRSHLSIIRPHNLVQEIENTSARLTLPVLLNGSKGLDAIDNKYDRTLILDEFSERFSILVKRIIEGNLDDLLSFSPEVIIHAIMGLSGELLGQLGIDPKKGETYAMLNEILNPEKGPNGNKLDFTPLIKSIQVFFDSIPKKDVTPTTPTVPKVIPVSDKIGIVGFDMDSEIAADMGLEKETRGILIIEIIKDSIAEKAGLRSGITPAKFKDTMGMIGGDVIIGVEDKTINSIKELNDFISHYHVRGTSIKFRVLRKKIPIEVVLVY